MNEREPDDTYPHVDTGPSEHEQVVAEEEEGTEDRPGLLPEPDTADDGAARTSRDDLTADRQPGDESTA